MSKVIFKSKLTIDGYDLYKTDGNQIISVDLLSKQTADLFRTMAFVNYVYSKVENQEKPKTEDEINAEMLDLLSNKITSSQFMEHFNIDYSEDVNATALRFLIKDVFSINDLQNTFKKAIDFIKEDNQVEQNDKNLQQKQDQSNQEDEQIIA